MFTDEILDLLNKLDNNSFVQSIIMHEYFQNLPKEKNNLVRSTLQDFIKKDNKQLYSCQHNGCNEKVINSHEISEKSFLKKLLKNSNKLWIISNNFKGNSLSYYFKDKPTKSVSVFPGYCEYHDDILFKELDNFSKNYNDSFINKQALRSVKKEIFNHKKTISMLEDTLENLLEIPLIKDTSLYQNMQKKLQIQQERLKRLWIIYNKISSGIQSEKYKIYHRIYDVNNEDYIFSIALDLSKNNNELTPIFIYKFIIAYFNNKKSINLVNEMLENNFNFYKSMYMYMYKAKLIMNNTFINNLTPQTKKILLQNEELNEYEILEYISLKDELGLEKIFNKTLESK